jgi:hypothetical protein
MELVFPAIAVFFGCAGQTLAQGFVQTYIKSSFAMLNVWLSVGQGLILLYAIYVVGSWQAVVDEYNRVPWWVFFGGGTIVYGVDYTITLAIYALGGAKASLFFVLVMPASAIVNSLLGIKTYTNMQIAAICTAAIGSVSFGIVSAMSETLDESPLSAYLWIVGAVGTMLAMSTWQAFYARDKNGILVHATCYTGITGIWMSLWSFVSLAVAAVMQWESPGEDAAMIFGNFELLMYYALLPISQGLNVNGYAAIIALPQGGAPFAECVRLCARLVPWTVRVAGGTRPFRILEVAANSLIIAGAGMYQLR